MRLASGVTTIEIIIATGVLALTILIAVSAYVGIINVQEKGAAARETQQGGRSVIEAIAREARSASTVEVCCDGAGQPILDSPGTQITMSNLTTPGVPSRFYLDPGSHSVIKVICSPDCASGPRAAVNSDNVRVTSLRIIKHDDRQPYLTIDMQVEQEDPGLNLILDSSAFTYTLSTLVTLRAN